jgi:hypothetical protein
MALQKAFGVKMDTLMRMQSAYDIPQTRKREKQIRVRPRPPSGRRRLQSRTSLTAVGDLVNPHSRSRMRPFEEHQGAHRIVNTCAVCS